MDLTPPHFDSVCPLNSALAFDAVRLGKRLKFQPPRTGLPAYSADACATNGLLCTGSAELSDVGEIKALLQLFFSSLSR